MLNTLIKYKWMNKYINNWISVGIEIIFAFYDNPISHEITGNTEHVLGSNQASLQETII